MWTNIKKFWKEISVVLGLGVAVAFAAGVTPTVITVNSRSINGDFFSPSTVIPAAQSVTVQATMTDAVYHSTSTIFSLMFQYSKDGGTTWQDDVGCSWHGASSSTDPLGNPNPRPSCQTDISSLVGQKGRLHINAPSAVTMGATITFQ